MKTVPPNKRGKNAVLIFIKKNLALGMGIHNKLKRIVFTIVILSVLFHLILELNYVTVSKEIICGASTFVIFMIIPLTHTS